MSIKNLVRLHKALEKLFPDLSPGEILFELDIPLTKYQDWQKVSCAALAYANQYQPDLVEEFEQITKDQASE